MSLSSASKIGSNHKPKPEPKPEPFSGFFENWLHDQEKDLLELVAAAAKAHPESTQSGDESTRSLSRLVGRVMAHYQEYYRVKSESTRRGVLPMLTPSWRSTLEDAFLWIGGWRPSMAFHLLYSKSGLQLEAGLNELMSGLNTGDLGDLSPSQLCQVNELQLETIKEERELTEAMAAHQESVADSSMVNLSSVVSELMRESRHDDSGSHGTESSVDERVKSTLGRKEDGLEEILGKADDLRLRTLRKVVDILSPIQAVHFLIGAAELHLRLHDWGKQRDARALVANGAL